MAGSMTPAGVASQALDAIGWPEVLGDLEEGTHQAQVALRAYGECLKQLLRAAHWDFARRQVPLLMLADASGQTANVGTVVPQGWRYEYAYPIDCAKMRFVPANFDQSANGVPAGNISINLAVPQNTGQGVAQAIGLRLQPTRFLLTNDPNYPVAGVQPWDVPGISPQGRLVILSNVRNASAVYTMQAIYPSMWDALFRSAFVAYLASEIAIPIWAKKDVKVGMAMMNAQIPKVTGKVAEARAVSANEGTSGSDIAVDWMRVRRGGGSWGGGSWGAGWDGGGGDLYCGWDSLSLASGAVF